jgi:potassium transporter
MSQSVFAKLLKLSGDRLFRVHGLPGRVAGAGPLQGARPRFGSSADLVSAQPRDRDSHPRGKGMAMWRERLFAAMARHARTAGDYFNIPAAQVIELGTKLEI